MGRHSAGDDDDVVEAPVDPTADTAALDLEPRAGRHASADAEPDDQPTQMIAAVDPEVVPDDRHDTDVLVLPPGFPDGPPPGPMAGPDGFGVEPPLAPSRRAQRAEQRAQKKAAKAAHKAAMAAERQALQRADDEAAGRVVPGAATEPPAVAEGLAEAPTDDLPVIEPVIEPVAASPALESPAPEPDPADPEVERVPAEAAAQPVHKESGTRADLRLLRRNSAVRARCIAAVLVSFLLYTIVLVIIGRTGVYLFWVWIPIVLSGVLVGTFLDLAHRDADKPTPAP